MLYLRNLHLSRCIPFIGCTLLIGMLTAAFSTGLSCSCLASRPDHAELNPGERETLRRYARDTWKSFEAISRAGDLPADGLRRDQKGTWEPTRKTTPTDIAAYLWSILAADNLGIIEANEARRRMEKTLTALGRRAAGPRVLLR